MRGTYVLLLFNLRKFEGNQIFVSASQSVREEGGRLEAGLLVRKSWVSRITAEIDIEFD